MTDDEALRKFGLPAKPEHGPAIRAALTAECGKSENEASDADLLRCLAAQLFSLGDVEDSLLIWRIKSSGFDQMSGIDVQLLCGAGIEETKAYLRQVDTADSRAALAYLNKCHKAGDFDDWTPEQWVAFHRRYFELDPRE